MAYVSMGIFSHGKNKCGGGLMPAGRPSVYTPEIAEEICIGLSEGKSLAALCREIGVGYATVGSWLRTNKEFQADYIRAREDQADADADAIGDIAARVLTGEIDPQAARVAIDAYKWAAGKRKPKVYGDKVQLGGDADNPVQAVVQVITGVPRIAD